MQPRYRAWIKKEQCYRHVTGLEFDRHGNLTEVKTEDAVTGHDPWEYMPEEVELEQYTGLLDRNGKEIYEGDIIKVVSKVEPEFKAGAVTMQQQQFIVVDALIYDSPRLTHCEWLGRYTEHELEIIGNVHQNKELLEDEDAN